MARKHPHPAGTGKRAEHESTAPIIPKNGCLLDAALEYAKHGRHVFPLCLGGTTPLTPRGHRDASANSEKIRRWWQRWPMANIGIPTGKKSGLVAFICKSPEAVRTLHSMTGCPVSEVEILAPDGSRIFIYRRPKNGSALTSVRNFLPGVDAVGDGDFVVVPPSRIRDAHGVLQ